MTVYAFEAQWLSPKEIKLVVYAGEEKARPLRRRDVLSLWRGDDHFCALFSGALRNVPFDGFFWELPPLSPATLDLPFECVLTLASSLEGKRADVRPFAMHMNSDARRDAIAFPNIGGDAELIVPRDLGGEVDYAHLARFLRSADAAQVRALWAKVGQTAERWLSKGKPFWVSTSGLGVAWLHVRVDSSPKYYAHRGYRQIA